MNKAHDDRPIGPVIVDDNGDCYQLVESQVRSALGATGGALIAFAAWDFGGSEWVTLNGAGPPAYLPPFLRYGVRWAGFVVGGAICRAAWREQAPTAPAEVVDVNGQEFVPGKKRGGDE